MPRNTQSAVQPFKSASVKIAGLEEEDDEEEEDFEEISLPPLPASASKKPAPSMSKTPAPTSSRKPIPALKKPTLTLTKPTPTLTKPTPTLTKPTPTLTKPTPSKKTPTATSVPHRKPTTVLTPKNEKVKVKPKDRKAFKLDSLVNAVVQKVVKQTPTIEPTNLAKARTVVKTTATPKSFPIKKSTPKHLRKKRTFEDDEEPFDISGESDNEEPELLTPEKELSILLRQQDVLNFDLLDEDFVLEEHGKDKDKTVSPVPSRRCPWIEEADSIRDLVLPKSSEDLLVPIDKVLSLLELYEILRRFYTVLRLSPFRFEDFCAALRSDEQNNLLAEIHVALLKALIHEDEAKETTLSRVEDKMVYWSVIGFLDEVTWPEVLRLCLQSYRTWHSLPGFDLATSLKYPEVADMDGKIAVLRMLCCLFMETDIARNFLSESPANEDNCRKCGRGGKLLCCERCPATYHLDCATPPLQNVPKGDWFCDLCTKQNVKGFTDCFANEDKRAVRQDFMGTDRHGRQYRFIARRIVVDPAEAHPSADMLKKVYYYSSPAQFHNLLATLDNSHYERSLYNNLMRHKEEILRQMEITMELTDQFKGDAFLTAWLMEEDSNLIKRVASELGRRKIPEPLYQKMKAKASANADVETTLQQDKPRSLDDKSEMAKAAESSCETSVDQGEKEGPRVIKITREAVRAMMEQRKSGSKGDAKSLLEKAWEVSSQATSEQKTKEEQCKPFEIEIERCDKAYAGLLEKYLKQQNVLNGNATSSTKPKGPMNIINLDPYRRDSGQGSRKVGRPKKGSAETTAIPKRPPSTIPFKLGMEGSFRTYTNYLNTHPMARNQAEKQKERERHRNLGRRFLLSGEAQFSWPGGSRIDVESGMIRMLRMCLFQLASRIPSIFFHSEWKLNIYSPWKNTVMRSVSPAEFAAAMATLEAFLRLSVFSTRFRNCLGDIRLFRETKAEKEVRFYMENVRKIERVHQEKLLEVTPEETQVDNPDVVWVKYPKGPPKHKIWKMINDEQYRVNGLKALGGWTWVSIYRTERVTNTYSKPRFSSGFQQKVWKSDYADFVDKLLEELSYSADLQAYLFHKSFQVTSTTQTPTSASEPACESLPLYFDLDIGAFVPEKDLAIEKLGLEHHVGTINVSLGLSARSVYTKKPLRKSRLDGILAVRETQESSREIRNCSLSSHHGCYSPTCRSGAACYSFSCRNKLLQPVLPVLPNVPESACPFVLTSSVIKRRSKKNQMPCVHRFKPDRSKSSAVQTRKMSLIVLPSWQLKLLARKPFKMDHFEGYRETAKQNSLAWPYPCARPTFQTCWRYRSLQANSFAGIALLFRQLYASIRWNELLAERPKTEKVILHGEDSLEQHEIIAHQFLPPFGLGGRYLLRVVSVPYELDADENLEEDEEEAISQRGRKRKLRVQKKETKEPTFTENWIEDDQIDLLVVRLYLEKLAIKQQDALRLNRSSDASRQVDDAVLKPGIRSRAPKPQEFGSTLRPVSPLRSVAEGSREQFRLTSKIVRDVIQQGLMTAEDEEIKEKLMELQHSYLVHPDRSEPMPLTGASGLTRSARKGGRRTRTPEQFMRVPRPAVETSPSNMNYYISYYGGIMPSGLDREEREEFRRLKDCTRVLEFVVDKVSRADTSDQRRRQTEVLRSEKRVQLMREESFRWELRRIRLRQRQLLDELGSGLKREIYKRRSALIRAVKNEIDDELAEMLGFQKPQNQAQFTTYAQPEQRFEARPVQHFVQPRPLQQQVPLASVRQPQQQNYVPPQLEKHPEPVLRYQPMEDQSQQYHVVIPAGEILSGECLDMPIIAEFVDVVPEPEQPPKVTEPQPVLTTAVPPLKSQYATPVPKQSKTESPYRHTTPKSPLQNQQPTARDNTDQRPVGQMSPRRRIDEVSETVKKGLTKEQPFLPLSSMAGMPPSSRMKTQRSVDALSPTSRKKSDLKAKSPLDTTAPLPNVQNLKSPFVKAREGKQPPASPPLSASEDKRRRSKSTSQQSSTGKRQKLVSENESGSDEELSRKGEMPKKGIATSSTDPILVEQLMKSAKKTRHCICNTPYDAKKFYIGCTLCSNWFHGSCVGVSEKQARKLTDWECPDCLKEHVQTKQELYCICQKPYDETKFYVACDLCQEWFHGDCVNITEAEADGSFMCPSCAESSWGRAVQRPLGPRELDLLRKLLKSLQTHKMSWPFLEPVDEKEVPDYYYWVKDPMDLHTMENKLATNKYNILQEFISDCAKIFDNCRSFNQKESVVSQCAEVLEKFYTERMRELREKLAEDS